MMRRPEDNNNKEGESPLVEDINLKAAFPECSGRPTVDKKVDVSPSSS